ncbi:hypothetical protein AXG93_2528s1310 [Marchantia polymorpha subsp. ruderalis]|uniref:Uncharacterized protein n=1 Tax=Marchantia polymorpha subsp. ruderalis TaxID=1480154 RepID=A0A176WQG7_MARPO|nr:hypothetical protein AXG93_2528s1310 [Marchantia polymorpha subsp. ruderalis]
MSATIQEESPPKRNIGPGVAAVANNSYYSSVTENLSPSKISCGRNTKPKQPEQSGLSLVHHGEVLHAQASKGDGSQTSGTVTCIGLTSVGGMVMCSSHARRMSEP